MAGFDHGGEEFTAPDTFELVTVDFADTDTDTDDASVDGDDVIVVAPPSLLGPAGVRVEGALLRMLGNGRHRSLVLTAGAVAIAGVIGLVGVLHSGTASSPHHSRPSVVALPTSNLSAPTGIRSELPPPIPENTFGPADADLPNLGTPLVFAGGTPLDLAIADTSLYVLLDSQLTVVDSYTREIIAQAPISANSHSHLVLDIGANVWVVDENVQPARVEQFNASNLAPQNSFIAPGTILGATSLDGSLFLATSLGVDQLLPGASTLTPVQASNPPVTTLTTEPGRDAVVGLIAAGGGGLITISSDGNTTEAGPELLTTGPELPTAGGSLAVVGNRLWIGGLGQAGIVAQVDPVTMTLVQPTVRAAVEPGGLSPVVVSAGANDLWAYSTASKQLFCLDANSGAELERWNNVAGPVTAGGSGPYSISGGQVIPLILQGNCTG